MQVDEIVTVPSRDQDISKYQGVFADQSKVKAFNGLTFAENQTNQSHELGLFDDENLVAYLRLDTRDQGKWQITYSQTESRFRGQGCFRYLLTKGVLEHGAVLSDSHQTQEAIDAWKSLIRFPGGQIQILLYDVDTGKTSKTHGVPEEEIWNQRTNTVLMASKQKYTSEGLHRMQKRDQWHQMHGTNRDCNSIWYGPDSSTDSYFNP